MLITEIDKAELAGDVKLWLSELYPEEMKIAFFAPSEKFPRKVQLIPLYEMDRQKKFDHTCCIYVPAVPLKERERFCFADLEEIMKLLEQINDRGTTVLVVTHNKDIVNAMRKRVVTMHNGKIISDEKEGGYHEA